jgi:hypothetical protein
METENSQLCEPPQNFGKVDYQVLAQIQTLQILKSNYFVSDRFNAVASEMQFFQKVETANFACKCSSVCCETKSIIFKFEGLIIPF